MTVRWKPLLILSGLFFLVAVVGVIAMAWTLVPRTAAGILKQARGEAAQGRFENAKIYYQQALQLESKNAAIHEEIAAMYMDWAKAAPDRAEDLRSQWTVHMVNATKLDKKALTPRKTLLGRAMAQDQTTDAVHWARDILKLDPSDADANYVLAIEELDAPSLNVTEVRQHVKALEAQKAAPIRMALVRARLAQGTGDEGKVEEAFAAARAIVLAPDAGPVDQLARVRLEAMQIQAARDLAGQEAPVKALLEHIHAMVSAPDLPSGRVTKLSQILEQTQRSLVQRSGRYKKAGAGTAATAMADAIEGELEGIFQKVLGSSQKADLQVYFTYADHLRFRQQRDRCLQVVDEALRLPAASQPANALSVMGMHTVAVEMALSKQDDAARYQKAEPHVQALVSSTETRFQGLGNLFRGAIELEQSGVAGVAAKLGEKAPTAEVQPKLRAMALAHLKLAASQLPNLPEAQARYGVALVLNQEQGLGRQYLQNAMRMGNLDPQYQFWAAWTILQAGYPEVAAPIVEALFRALAQGSIPADMEPTLHQMSGELYQARRAPGDLERAAREFDKAAKANGNDTLVALRQAQVDVQLGQHDRALERIDSLRKRGIGGPQAENLAVVILEDQGKHDEARSLLGDARKRFPKSPDLVALEAAFAVKDGKAEDADRLLKEYLKQDPDNVTLTLTRAEILADKQKLNRPKEAREILSAVADRTENSTPLMQLARIELEQDDLVAAAATVAKVRSRWKESAAGDVLDGQLALKRGSIPKAREFFAEALKKDPDNKIIQYWKAHLDSRVGSVAEAEKTLENLVRERPSKEVDAGVTLLSAAQSSLARLEIQTGRIDDAIRRYEELKKSSETGTLSRADRWQLISAYSAKNQWPVARRELAGLLNDPKSPPSSDERVRGALLYREHKEEAAALAQLTYVLSKSPENAGAVVLRAYIFLEKKSYEEGAGLIRNAIGLIEAKKEKPDHVMYLMLAAIENEKPPKADAPRRARQVLEAGLAANPDSLEIVKAEYLLLNSGGDPAGALAMLREKAKSDPKGGFRRFLVDVLQENRQYEEAEGVLRELVQQSPDDAGLAYLLVQSIAMQAASAANAGQADRQRSLDEKAMAKIREGRKRFPDATIFLEAECDVVARSGDFTRALAITEEIDKLAPMSPTGPILRAQLYARQDRPADVVKCLALALERNPRQTRIRLELGQELLRLGRADEALVQARATLEANPQAPEAILLEARALSATGVGHAAQDAARAEAASHLEEAVAANPKFREAYLVLADIAEARGRRPEALAALRRGYETAPQDVAMLARLVQCLAGPGPGGSPPTAEGLADARRIAAEVAEQDKAGSRLLAAAVGFHKAGQFDLALPLATKAAEMLDTPVAHLNLGDLVLSMAEAAEAQQDHARSKPRFEQAVQEYDRVLKLQPWQVEAVNNKAWILHSYLNRSEPALELAQELLKHANPATLPGEFYDTLGCIQEKLGRKAEAEKSYQSGLSRSPEHPVLNYHFGKLLAENPGRESKARGHLTKALASRDQLSPSMARDAEEVLARRPSGSPRAN